MAEDYRYTRSVGRHIYLYSFFVCLFLLQNVDTMTTVVIYPTSATIFAATCACIFTIVGILGEFSSSSRPAVATLCYHLVAHCVRTLVVPHSAIRAKRESMLGIM